MSDTHFTNEPRHQEKPRSTIQKTFGFVLGILICVGCLLGSILLGAASGLRQIWIFPLFNTIALVGSGVLVLRRIHKSSYPEGVLIAVSLGFLFNLVFFAVSLTKVVE